MKKVSIWFIDRFERNILCLFWLLLLQHCFAKLKNFKKVKFYTRVHVIVSHSLVYSFVFCCCWMHVLASPSQFIFLTFTHLLRHDTTTSSAVHTYFRISTSETNLICIYYKERVLVFKRLLATSIHAYIYVVHIHSMLSCIAFRSIYPITPIFLACIIYLAS